MTRSKRETYFFLRFMENIKKYFNEKANTDLFSVIAHHELKMTDKGIFLKHFYEQ